MQKVRTIVLSVHYTFVNYLLQKSISKKQLNGKINVRKVT